MNPLSFPSSVSTTSESPLAALRGFKRASMSSNPLSQASPISSATPPIPLLPRIGRRFPAVVQASTLQAIGPSVLSDQSTTTLDGAAGDEPVLGDREGNAEFGRRRTSAGAAQLSEILGKSSGNLTEEFELDLPLNPFRMAFENPTMEQEYQEWSHLKYIPVRIWLVLSAFIVEGDMISHGFLEIDINAILLHIVAGLQIITFGLMCLPACRRIRRYLILVMGLHSFFWTGNTTQDMVGKLSTFHQNNFIALPFYCAFSCVLATQIPIRFSLFAFCILPVLNALWRLLVYYDFPVSAVLLVWWWLIALWAYIFERILRHLFLRLRKFETMAQKLKDQQAQSLSFLHTLISPCVVKHLCYCRERNLSVTTEKLKAVRNNINVNVKGSGTPRSEIQKPSSSIEKMSSTAAETTDTGASTVLTTTRYGEFAQVVVIVLRWGESSSRDSHVKEVLRAISEIARAFEYQCVEMTVFRCVCVQMISSVGKSVSAFLSELVSRDGLPVDPSVVKLCFAVHVAPAVAGFVVTPQLCRYVILCPGIATAHSVAHLIDNLSGHGRGLILESCLTHTDIIAECTSPRSLLSPPSSDQHHRGSGEAKELSEGLPKSKPDVEPSELTLGPVLSFQISPTSPLGPAPALSVSHRSLTMREEETVAATSILLTLMHGHAAASAATTKTIAPTPAILWKEVFSWSGIHFEHPSHERTFKLFVMMSSPEVIALLASCTSFCGLWCVVSLSVMTGASASFELPGHPLWWILVHLWLFLVSSALGVRVYRLIRRKSPSDFTAVRRLTVLILLIEVAHYFLSIATVFTQSNLMMSQDWDDYIKAANDGHALAVLYANQHNINVLYNISYFLLFSVYFCTSIGMVLYRTTGRLALIIGLFLFHTITCSVVFKHTDFVETCVLLVVFVILFTIESLLRISFRTLLLSNRCREDIEQQPEMQNRQMIMLAAIPQRLQDSSELCCFHPSAAAVILAFPALEDVLRKSDCTADEASHAINDLCTLTNAVHAVLQTLPFEASIVQPSLNNGRIGLVLLMLPEQTVGATDFQASVKEALTSVSKNLLGQSLRALYYPPILTVSCTFCPVEELYFGELYQLCDQAMTWADLLLKTCIVNTIAFQSIEGEPMFRRQNTSDTVGTSAKASSSLHDRRLSSHASSFVSSTSIQSLTMVRMLRTGPHMPSSSSGASPTDDDDFMAPTITIAQHNGGVERFASKSPSRGSQASPAGSTRGVRRLFGHRRSAVMMTVPAQPPQMVFIAMVWRFPFDRIGGATRQPFSEATEDPESNVQGGDVAEVEMFNRGYVTDMLLMYALLRRHNGRITIAQSTVSDGVEVVFSTDAYQAGVSLAASIHDAIVKAHPESFCIGLGVAMGRSKVPFMSAPLAAVSLWLARLNASHKIAAPPKFGSRILINASAKQWCQTSYSVKAIFNEDDENAVFRLCSGLKQAQVQEWMYMLQESNESNPFRLYNTAFSQLNEGHLSAARSTLQQYLALYPGDPDALHLQVALESKANPPMQVSTP